MVHLEKRKRNTRVYVYLCKKERIAGKVKRTLNEYLGPEDSISHESLAKPSVDTADVKSFGYSAALWKAASILGLSTLINENTTKRMQGISVGDYITLAAVNRADEPGSKSAILGWFIQTWLAHELKIPSKSLTGQNYWNHLEYLTPDAINHIEVALDQKLITEFHLSLECLLFDATNFQTYIQNPTHGDLPHRGKAKAGRNDLNLIALSLMTTRKGGFPLMHRTYAGNTNDSKHFKAMIPAFVERCKALNQVCADITLIFDKGNNSKENIADLRTEKLHYLVSLRPTSFKHLLILPEDQFQPITLKNGKEVLIYETREKVFDLPDQRVIVVKDKRREARAEQELLTRLGFILKEIATLRMQLNTGVWKLKRRVDAKLARILKRRAGKCVKTTVSGPDGQLTLIIELEGEQFDHMVAGYGRSFLTTNHVSWTPVEIVQAYRDQHIIEDNFKAMKCVDSIRATPMHHWTDQKISAHLYICVLALILKAVIRELLQQQQIFLSDWKTQQTLNSIRLVSGKMTDGTRFLKFSNVKGEAKRLAEALGLFALLKEGKT